MSTRKEHGKEEGDILPASSGMVGVPSDDKFKRGGEGDSIGEGKTDEPLFETERAIRGAARVRIREFSTVCVEWTIFATKHAANARRGNP